MADNEPTFQPASDLWEFHPPELPAEKDLQPLADETLQEVPEWAEEPKVPSSPTRPRCAVPMCGDSGTDMLSLPCSHSLHESCLRSILVTTVEPQCPMCRDESLARLRRIFETSRYAHAPHQVAPQTFDYNHLPPDTYGPPQPAPLRLPVTARRYGKVDVGGYQSRYRAEAGQRPANEGPPPKKYPDGRAKLGVERLSHLR